jgi:cellulose synthase/poly-beta-1,6-N-acetylglucosamine synthase-like glycosyltransferase
LNEPHFSVIITTFNRPAQLARALRALARSDYPRKSFEVIVVDDGGACPRGRHRRNLALRNDGEADPAGKRGAG